MRIDRGGHQHEMIYGERGAARLLGMNPEKLRYRMQQYGLRRPKKS